MGMGAVLGYALAAWCCNRSAALYWIDVLGYFGAALGAGVLGIVGANIRTWCQRAAGQSPS
jgi:hypothetical protein